MNWQAFKQGFWRGLSLGYLPDIMAASIVGTVFAALFFFGWSS